MCENSIKFKQRDPMSSIIPHPSASASCSVHLCILPNSLSILSWLSSPSFPTQGLKEQHIVFQSTMTKVPNVPFHISNAKKLARRLWGKFSLLFETSRGVSNYLDLIENEIPKWGHWTGIYKTNPLKWNVAWLQNLLALACKSEIYWMCVCRCM